MYKIKIEKILTYKDQNILKLNLYREMRLCFKNMNLI